MKVDWKKQWSLFAENFYEGKAHISLGQKTLLLLPGPGFGDLSHPTTALMLELMRPYVADEAVLDIGTGSGILALAALLLGARSAYGIDIDPEALAHARKNNALNGLKARFSLILPQKSFPSIGLMNMIFSEQRTAFSSRANENAKLWITSGLLETQESEYLSHTVHWGWKLRVRSQKEGWLGFVFDQKGNFA